MKMILKVRNNKIILRFHNNINKMDKQNVEKLCNKCYNSNYYALQCYNLQIKLIKNRLNLNNKCKQNIFWFL